MQHDVHSTAEHPVEDESQGIVKGSGGAGKNEPGQAPMGGGDVNHEDAADSTSSAPLESPAAEEYFLDFETGDLRVEPMLEPDEVPPGDPVQVGAVIVRPRESTDLHVAEASPSEGSSRVEAHLVYRGHAAPELDLENTPASVPATPAKSKGGPGRPPIGQGKRERFYVYANPNEKAEIERNAAAHGQGVSKYMRTVALHPQGQTISRVTKSLAHLTIVERFLHSAAALEVSSLDEGPGAPSGEGTRRAGSSSLLNSSEVLEALQTAMSTLSPLIQKKLGGSEGHQTAGPD